MGDARTCIIGCGALARELLALNGQLTDAQFDLKAMPAKLHNRPDQIPDAVEAAIIEHAPHYDRVLVAYGDCGTAGKLDEVLEKYDIPRIEGAHCYAIYAGLATFDALQDAEPGTFYLTDFLVRQFETLIYQPLGLEDHPELTLTYFGNYTRLVYLAQVEDCVHVAKAREAAKRLGLNFEYRVVGYGGLADFVQEHAA